MKKLIKMLTAAAVLTVMIIPQTGCGKKTEPVTKESFYFDTVCQVTVYDMKNMSEDNAKDVIGKAFSQCEKYEKLLSKTKRGSDIYKINHAAGKAVQCDGITIEVIKKGLEYSKLTNGKFDITIGKAQDTWDFHNHKSKPPAKEKLAKAMKYVDYKQVRVNGNKVQMGTSKGEIDLGAVAKGYIADGIAKYLKEQGVTSAIISLGGNIECVGNKGGKPFNIGIEKPFSERSDIVGACDVDNETIVTSGIYERYIKYKGKKYHHILDSKTGMPVDSDVVGVSIKSDFGHSGDCDGLSTTCLILGSKEGKRLIEKMKGYEALFILKNGKLVRTKGFELKEE